MGDSCRLVGGLEGLSPLIAIPAAIGGFRLNGLH
jgi:hypothetical protein